MIQKTKAGHMYRSGAVLLAITAIALSIALLVGHPVDLSAALFSVVPGLLLLSMAAVLWVTASAFDAIIARNETTQQVHHDIHSLAKKLDDVADRVSKLRPQGPGGAVTAPPVNQLSAVESQAFTSAVETLSGKLDDLRELTCLTDEERRDRHRMLAEELKLRRLRDAVEAVDAHQWSKADKLLATLEPQYPHDGQIAQLRMQLSRSRQDVEARTVSKIAETIEEYLSISSYDQAYSTAKRLTDDFPANTVAAALLERVARERELYNDSTAQRLFQEIRQHIDHRTWRTALTLATRMLETFPDHRRAESIRHQFQTIQDNAEIEERQEMEVRIQELIHEGRFDEATGLGEELMQRFPASPQAESLAVLLPRIRSLAEEQHNAVA